MWNPQKAGYLLRNILGSKVVKTNLKEDFHINYSVTSAYHVFLPKQQEAPLHTSILHTPTPFRTLPCFWGRRMEWEVNQNWRAIVQLFHGYDTSHVVSTAPLSSHSLSPYHDGDSGGWELPFGISP
ncbi:hypothetical protein TNCV_2719541 [Trichonephila clavipes]|nr:hypothetical protein TNCV_2719541 [Trichonephila clavipes]